MKFINRNIPNKKDLFFDLLHLAENEKEYIKYSILIFFENGEEIIKQNKQDEAYKEVVYFLENNDYINVYSSEDLSCYEKALILTYME